jgi:hypothetical protein
MAFCTNCGADVTGKNFCVQCGKMVSASQPAAAAAPPPPPTYAAAAPAAAGPRPPQPPVYAAAAPAAPLPPKKISPVVWVVVGIVGFFIVAGLVVMIGAGILVHKFKQNPALAAAKLMTLGNKDVEVVDSDAGRNTVTFRDKRTGETVTMNFDEIKRGRLVFKGDKGQQATLEAHGDGQTGSIEINGPKGSMKFGAGAGAKVPDWVPAYPGVNAQATFSVSGAEGEGGTFQFTTKDSAQSIVSYYEQALKRAGFKITANVSGSTMGANGGMLAAEDEANKHTFLATLGDEKGQTAVNVVFGTKK